MALDTGTFLVVFSATLAVMATIIGVRFHLEKKKGR